jgi:hypothetical protein
MADNLQYGIFLDLKMIPRVNQLLWIDLNHFIDDTDFRQSPSFSIMIYKSS